MDPLDKALTSRTYTTAQLESVSRAAMLRLTHSLSSSTLHPESLPRGMLHQSMRGAKSGVAGHVHRIAGGAAAARAAPGGLGAWSAAVSHDLAAVRLALNEPPQRLVQAALDHWIAADERRP